MLPSHFTQILTKFSPKSVSVKKFLAIESGKKLRLKNSLKYRYGGRKPVRSPLYITQNRAFACWPHHVNKDLQFIINKISVVSLVKKRLMGQLWYSYPWPIRDLQTCCTARRKEIQKQLVFKHGQGLGTIFLCLHFELSYQTGLCLPPRSVHCRTKRPPSLYCS